jgi:hypothetical protein
VTLDIALIFHAGVKTFDTLDFFGVWSFQRVNCISTIFELVLCLHTGRGDVPSFILNLHVPLKLLLLLLFVVG